MLIDARMCDDRPSGVSRYVTRIIRELRRQPGITPIALCGKEVGGALADCGVELCATDFDRTHRPIHRRWWWERRRLAALIARAGVDLYHATWNTGIPPRCPVPAVLTIHDLIPLSDLAGHFPSRLHRLCYLMSLHASVRQVEHIVTISHYVREDCIRRLHLAADRTTAVLNGVDRVDQAPDPDLVHQNYCLYVGGPEPRKNVAVMLGAMDYLWRKDGAAPALWLTGTLERQCPEARAAYASLESPERVRFLGAPDDRRLVTLMTSARALLLLSAAEGFGLPVAEALAHGCPVVVADRTSLPEVVGDAGLIVNPDDPAAVAEAIRRVTHDQGLRTELIGRGLRRAAAFSWANTADQITRIYRSAIARYGHEPRRSTRRLLGELRRNRRLYRRAGPDGIAEAF